MHQQIRIIPIRSNPIRNTPLQIHPTPPFKHRLHLHQNLIILSMILNHDRARILIPANDIDVMLLPRSPPLRNFLFRGNRPIGVFFLDVHFDESFVQALLEAFGDVFGGTGESPPVFGVVGGEKGRGHEGHPAVVPGVAVLDSRHLLESTTHNSIPARSIRDNFLQWPFVPSLVIFLQAMLLSHGSSQRTRCQPQQADGHGDDFYGGICHCDGKRSDCDVVFLIALVRDIRDGVEKSK
mmetsp:Transcript_24652/g.49130  ORF Transcript_24652/g.49130 Transcript_24652/m.49130 type:complete len:238 (-) Transcript_24652:43-756(-)